MPSIVGVSQLIGQKGQKGDPGGTGPQGPMGPGLRVLGSVLLEADLPASADAAGDSYLVEATDETHTWNGSAWVNLGSITGPEGPAGPAGPRGIKGDPKVTVDEAEPVTPEDGDIWFNPDPSEYPEGLLTLTDANGLFAGVEVETAVERVDPGVAGADRQTVRVVGGVPRWRDSPNFFARDYLTGNAAENASPGLAALVAAAQGSNSVGVGGGNIAFEPGDYRLTTTLDLTRWTGRFGGAGSGKTPGYFDPGNATVFRWDGPADVPMFRVRDSREVIFENFRVQGKDTARPSYAFEFNNVSGDGSGTNSYLTLRDLHIGKWTWHAQPDWGEVKNGIGFTGDNTNNDQFRIERVTIDGASEYGLYVPNSQSVGGVTRSLVISNAGIAAIGIAASIGLHDPEFYLNDLNIHMLGNNAVVVVDNIRSEMCDMLARTSPGGALTIRGGLVMVNDTITGGQVLIDASPMDNFALSLEDLLLTGNTTPSQARIEIGPVSPYVGRFFVSVKRGLDMHKDQLVFASGASMWAASPMSKGVVEWQSQYGNSIHQFRNELRQSGTGSRTTLNKAVWDAPITD
jgi:hypothetical protein